VEWYRWRKLRKNLKLRNLKLSLME
jgi:hypothetical protein